MASDREEIPYHPKPEPRFPGAITPENIRNLYRDCTDFWEREVLIGGDPNKRGVMFTIIGMVKTGQVNDSILKPLTEGKGLQDMAVESVVSWMLYGGLYNMAVVLRDTLDQVVFDLAMGNAILLLPGESRAVSCFVPSEDGRGISQPENEPVLKGARDSFVENIRVNSVLIRRRLRTPALKIKEELVGRQSLTPVDIFYIEELTNPDLVQEAQKRIREIDIDALLSTANLEEYLADSVKTPFPLMAYTERPDRFCAGLVEGRVGILADGLPMGFLLPGNFGQFFKTGEDKAKNWMEASFLRILRYVCLLVAIFLPALYVAAVNFHPEMIPASLAWSIVEAKVDVPFFTLFEVLILLIAFEIVQEAGLRLPPAIGTTVSILGGLVVGTAAVEARIVSPAVLIVVAVAGIAGYTMPSQEVAGALRLWRLVLVIAAGISGLFGMVAAAVVLVHHVAALESFGVPYLTPFAAVGGEQLDGVLRRPLLWVKFRERALKVQNKRNQK
ncbi:MAG: Spore germination protein GerKA [Firmicutes bacterium]|nr:Spore germination protein GerKA [Bacillota bacterium]